MSKIKVKFYTHAEMLKEVEKCLGKASVQVRREAIDLMMHLAVWAVWDTIPNISKKRLKKILDFMGDKAAYIVDGTISLEDIRQMLKDEADITIGIKENER